MNKINEEIFEIDDSAPNEGALYDNGFFNPVLTVKEIVIFPKNKHQPEMAAFEAHHKDMIDFCKQALYHLKQWEKLFHKHEQIWSETPMKSVKKSKKYSNTTKITPQQIIDDYRKALNECLNGWAHNHKMPKGLIDRFNKVLLEGMERMGVEEAFPNVQVKWKRKAPVINQNNIIQGDSNE